MTAVEWVIEQLFGDNEIIGCSDELLNQAIEMEKQQIIDAYEYSYGVASFKTGTTSEQYYNETYKKPSA
jgi:hypothetical protein